MNAHFKMATVLDTTVPNLDRAFVMLLERTDVSDGRKDRVKAAVAKTSRLLRKPSNQLPAHLPYLMRQINRFKKPGSNPEGKTIANTKSEIRFLIRTVVGRVERSEFAPLSPDWASARSSITQPPILWKLSRFIAYCSTHGVSPENVNDETAANFYSELVACGDIDNPHLHLRAAIRAWNRASSIVPDWPGKQLSLPCQRRHRWTIHPDQLPQIFNKDAQGWLDRLGRDDPLGEEGPARPARPITIKHRKHQIYKAASALALSGFPIEQITSVAVLVEPENFQKLLRYLLERQGGNPSDALFRLACALRAIATHYVRATVEQLKRLRRIASGLEPEERRLGRRTEERLQPFDDERTLAALLHLPQRLIFECEHHRIKPRYARLLAQVAIAIEIELFTGLRLKNLAHLNLEKDIQVINTKGKKTWIIRLRREQTKNRSVLTYVLPTQSVELIQCAIKFYRQPDGWLFPGVGAGPKREGCLAGQIKRAVESRLSVSFNVHLFRGLGSSLHLKENPNGFESVRAFLGDRDDEVIRNSYTRFAERHLIAAAQDTILKARARTVPTSTNRNGKSGRVHP